MTEFEEAMRWLIWLVGTIGIAAATPLLAADQSSMDCEGKTVEGRISGCTQVLSRRNLVQKSRARALNNRGNAYFDRNDYDLAIADYTEALRLAPRDAIILSNRGNTYRLKGDTASALNDLDASLRLNAKNSIAYNLRGIVHDNRGDLDRALADYDQSIRLNPNYSTAWVNRSITYRKKGNNERALSDATEAIRVDPKNANAYNERGFLYQSMRQFDRALSEYTEALRLREQDYFYNNRGLVLNEMGQFDRAISDFDQAIRLDPNYGVAFNNRGWTYSRKGEYDRAISDFSQAIRINPRYSTAYANRGFAHYNKDDLDRALADYDETIRLAPRWDRGYNERGLTFYRKGNPDRALADFDEAIRISPRDGHLWGNRAAAWNAKGDHDRALADLDEALRLAPKSARVHYHRGFAFEKKGSLANALASYEAALAIQATERDAIAGRDRVRGLMGGQPAKEPVRPPPLQAEPPPPSATPPARTQVRVALVIGNGAYARLTPLPNPPNDARDIAAALGSLGFEVTLAVDATKPEMEEKLALFARSARRADVALAFYAGHGLQHQGVNYLAPVNAQITDETDLRLHFVRLPDVIADLQNANGVRVLMLDACRDNEAIKALAASLPRSRAAAVRGGLAGEKAEGILIAFATQPDRVASDGTGRNSPFTGALLKHLGTPGQEIRTTLTRVRSDVLRATGGVQRPEVSDSLDGEFVFR